MIGSVPVHVPRLAVRVFPSSAAPEIVGGAVLVGTTVAAASPDPVNRPAAATAASDARQSGIAIRPSLRPV
ncbi:MAG TPA: hypothetical protein VEW70_08380, partial [Burkholderiales bacterium]|nr:hypothetical protein [Burkholderiales bacterium]